MNNIISVFILINFLIFIFIDNKFGFYISFDGNTIDYDYAKDGQGNIVAVIKDGVIITEYFYDAWGNTKVNILNNSDPFATLNPIRWRGHYYDSETEMYFINGRYYDPNLCSYIDSMEIETVLDSSNTIGALNLNAICTDNPTDLGANNFTVLTNTDLMPDPVYDPLAGYSWWDRNWKSVIRYGLFTLTFAVSIILMCIPGTQAFGIGMFNAGLGAAISGAIVGGLIGGIISAIQGNGFFKGFADSAITGFVDGFTAGAILYCVSSAVSAISKSIKAANQTSIKVDGQTIKLQNANKADFTDDAWKEIQSLTKAQNGETISNMASGRKIHQGYKSGMAGKEQWLKSGTGRMDYFDKAKNVIYELKPKNAKSITKGAQQLIRYNRKYSNLCKLVLVLY